MARKKRTSRGKNKGAGPVLANILKDGRTIVLVLSFVILGAFAYGMYYFLMTSDFFRIKEIVINKEGSYSTDSTEKKLKGLYMGRNIFTVDLDHVASMTMQNFSHLKQIEVQRVLPDKLEIDFIERVPAAYLAGSKGVIIDREGVVLSEGNAVNEGLVKITGLKFFKAPQLGEKLNNKVITKAIHLWEVIREKAFLKEYELDYIDVSDANNILLALDGVVIKMGNYDFAWKLTRLEEILKDPNVKFGEIGYIDLRFTDAIISPK